MAFDINGYTPKQGDFVIINFNPSRGRESKKEGLQLLAVRTILMQ
ncbi:hypothetical protein [Enterococcus mundtii]|nr:hypothetical protein [Enterococcus mundtii]MEC3940854.1 hypothetical protein [Enterococcus mundtii]